MNVVSHGLKFAIDSAVAFGARVTESFGLSPAHFDVLHALHGAPDQSAPRQRWFCEKLSVTAGTVTRALKKLEEGGFIERSRNPDDARAKRTTFTERGLTTIRDALRELQLGTSGWIRGAVAIAAPFLAALCAIVGLAEPLTAPCDDRAMMTEGAGATQAAMPTKPPPLDDGRATRPSSSLVTNGDAIAVSTADSAAAAVDVGGVHDG
jgi:DNA-binding MarR family transcriptional regulator